MIYLRSSVVHLVGISLVLNVLLWLTTTSWGRWEPLSRMKCNLDSIPLSETTVRESSFTPTGIADQSVPSFSVCYPQPASPAHSSIEDSTGHHRLRKHPAHSPADIEGPQPSQKKEKTLSFPVALVFFIQSCLLSM